MSTSINTENIKQELNDYYFPVLTPCTFNIEHHEQKPLVEVLPRVVVVNLTDRNVAEIISNLINRPYNLRKRL